jgi:glycosyltransferase involved in cell wall biosynthesis
MPPVPQVEVLLPCLDEAEALPWVLSRMPAGCAPLVVDNGSTDGSAEIARASGARVVAASERGYGAACHAGLLAATAEIVVVMDADASLDPADLDRVLAPIREGCGGPGGRPAASGVGRRHALAAPAGQRRAGPPAAPPDRAPAGRSRPGPCGPAGGAARAGTARPAFGVSG